MKKFSLLMAALMIGNIVVVPQALAGYHYSTTQQPQFQSDEERALYQKYYDEKDLAKKAAIAKEFLEKFPKSAFAKYAEGTITKHKQTEASTNFRASLDEFYKPGADEAKLNKLLADSETFLTVFPNNAFAITQMALATGSGTLGGYYKDVAKSQALAEKALKALEPTTTPDGWKKEEWDKFRTQGISSITLYQGLYQLRQPTPNVEQAVAYFNKVTENKDWPSAKEPATYLLRAEANNIIYDKLSEEYRALSEDDKRGDKGKAILAQIDPVVDALIDDYARALGIVSKNPVMKAMADDLRPRLENFWKYRHEGKLDGLDAHVKHFEADPTVAPPPRTASVAPATTTPGGTKPKG